MVIFQNKILLITGGTGSFGNAVLKRFLDTDIKEIRIFSRDEKKQDDMRHQYQNPKIKFYIGDVRDKRSVDTAMREDSQYWVASFIQDAFDKWIKPHRPDIAKVILSNTMMHLK